jgi:hypothetical protein
LSTRTSFAGLPVASKLVTFSMVDLADRAERLGGEKGLVGRDQHIGEGKKACEDVILDQLLGEILEEQSFLFLVHVQAKISDLARFQAGDHRLRVHDGAPARVDQHHAPPHATDRASIDHVMGCRRQRAVQRDDVARIENFFRLDVSAERLDVRPSHRVAREDGAAEAVQDPGDYGPDLACTNHAYGAAREIEAKQVVEREISFSNAVVGTVNLPVERQDECDRMLGHGMR